MKTNRDKVIMILRVIVGACLLAYVGLTFVNNGIIVKSDFLSANLIILGFVGLIGLAILMMGIFVIAMPRQRLSQALLGIALILFANYFLKDSPEQNIFYRDILSLLGAFWTIAGPMGICVLDCVKKQIEEKNIEIIEV